MSRRISLVLAGLLLVVGALVAQESAPASAATTLPSFLQDGISQGIAMLITGIGSTLFFLIVAVGKRVFSFIGWTWKQEYEAALQVEANRLVAAGEERGLRARLEGRAFDVAGWVWAELSARFPKADGDRLGEAIDAAITVTPGAGLTGKRDRDAIQADPDSSKED